MVSEATEEKMTNAIRQQEEGSLLLELVYEALLIPDSGRVHSEERATEVFVERKKEKKKGKKKKK